MEPRSPAALDAPGPGRRAGASADRTAAPLLEIDDLSLALRTPGGLVPVVRGASLTVARGETVGLVGESGSGKTLTALAILRLLPPAVVVTGGTIRVAGEDVLGLDARGLRRLRGGRVGMVFQEPAAALDPVFTVGFQIAEAVRAHQDLGRRAATAEAERLLELVALPDPRSRLRAYPHQLSGGQRQRVLLAIALAGRPELLVADEPTTALDVTIQAQILELLQSLRETLGLGVLLVTHDLAVVAATSARVVVLYAGAVVEEGPVAEVFAAPAHPYTAGLLAALPPLAAPAERTPLAAIPGSVPEPGRLPGGCPFHPRCGIAVERCTVDEPLPVALGPGRAARCHLAVPPGFPVPGADP